MQPIKINAKLIYKEQTKLLQDKVDYKLFKQVTEQFNKAISDKILSGYKLRNSLVGDILVVGKYKKGKNAKNYDIDWNKTNKLKAELEKQGKILYKEWKTEDGKVENNGGERYLVFYTDPIKYSWKWNKGGSAKFTKNIKKYRFIPTRFNKRELSRRIQENDQADITYDIYK